MNQITKSIITQPYIYLVFQVGFLQELYGGRLGTQEEIHAIISLLIMIITSWIISKIVKWALNNKKIMVKLDPIFKKIGDFFKNTNVEEDEKE